MVHVASIRVLHKLTRTQMRVCVENTPKFLDLIAEDSTYLNRMVMCDETWVYHYNLLTEWESKHWKRKNEPWEEKAWQQKPAGEFMLIVFFANRAILYQNFVPPKTTIIEKYYLKVLKILWQHVNCKCPELKKWWILPYNNVCSHTVRLVQEYIENTNAELPPLLPNSPGLTLCDFWLFLALKKHLHGR